MTFLGPGEPGPDTPSRYDSAIKSDHFARTYVHVPEVIEVCPVDDLEQGATVPPANRPPEDAACDRYDSERKSDQFART